MIRASVCHHFRSPIVLTSKRCLASLSQVEPRITTLQPYLLTTSCGFGLLQVHSLPLARAQGRDPALFMSAFVGFGGPSAKRVLVLCGDFMEGKNMRFRTPR